MLAGKLFVSGNICCFDARRNACSILQSFPFYKFVYKRFRILLLYTYFIILNIVAKMGKILQKTQYYLCLQYFPHFSNNM